MGRVITRAPFAKKLVHDLKKKASKRVCLPEALASVPFIVAMYNELTDLDEWCVLSTLTGSRIAARTREPIVHPPAVAAAYQGGWQRVLDEWDYGPSSELRFSDYGAYLESTDPWARELSGVLVAHGPALLQWLPNPFARPEINEPKLYGLFSWAKLGGYNGR